MPPFIVTVSDGTAAVVAAGSGRTVAAIPRPADIYAYEGVSGAADDRTFILAGADLSGGHWRTVFFRVLLDAAGKPGPVRQLPGQPWVVPTPVISGGWVDFDLAVSPDGSELAFASGTPFPSGPGTPYNPPLPTAGANERIVVQDVATGARRTWAPWRSANAVISQFSWGAGGLLGYDIVLAHAVVSGGTLAYRARAGNVAAFAVLHTEARGGSLATDSHVVTATTPRGTVLYEPNGVLGPDGKVAYVQLPRSRQAGTIAEVSVATGRTIRLLVSGYRARLGDPMSIDAGDRFLLFPLALRHPHVINTQRPFLVGHLARLSLRTGTVTGLRVPVIDRINGNFDAAW
ncbi:MAG TPA: hypothetical protein VLX31_02850 [Streptosporangiaceae bacterium]|nr:hypothetical protein [Streptosporangiaceae bacterium]